MLSTQLWIGDRWRVVLPRRRLTDGHLALVDTRPADPIDVAGAAGLIDAYRRTRSALARVVGHRGFMISFAERWRPDSRAIGEPEPESDGDDLDPRTVHVFGRGAANEQISPVRVMALPADQRTVVETTAEQRAALGTALSLDQDVSIPGPVETDCDGCRPSVLIDQERWRRDGMRVIRPRSPMITAQALVLPLRHVVSVGDLTAEEVVSLFARLGEVRDQFDAATGSSGLSCFANDGRAARQETPHVHVHVLGRSRGEARQPFEVLGGRALRDGRTTEGVTVRG